MGMVLEWMPDLASVPDRKVCGLLATRTSSEEVKAELQSLAKDMPTFYVFICFHSFHNRYGHFPMNISRSSVIHCLSCRSSSVLRLIPF